MNKQYTWEQIKTHKGWSSCWVVINDRIWDVTNFLQEHPAGANIILIWGGKDATDAFLEVHSESYLTSFLYDSFVGVVVGSGAEPLADPDASERSKRKKYDVDSVLAIPRNVYGPDHIAFRDRLRNFLRQEVIPNYSRYERKGKLDEKAMAKWHDAGFYLRFNIDKKYGGHGLTDWRYNAIVAEELEHNDIGGAFINLGNDMVLSYFTHSCTPAQRERWLYRIVKEKMVLAVAMSEPELGSDLAYLRTRAVKTPDGRHYIINGRKMWISQGSVADLVVCACVTDPSKGSRGISLIVIEKSTPGFRSAKKFGKMGKNAQDTCLLVMKDCKVPVENLVGEEGKGFHYMMSHLAKERLSIAVQGVAAARRALALTVNYVHGRSAFGGNIGGMQHVQFQLAQVRSDVQVATSFMDRCIADVAEGKLTPAAASLAKLHSTELANQVANKCLQFYGGYGFLKNNPVAKKFQDQRVAKIYGGASEVLLEVVSKGLGFTPQRLGRRARL